MGLFGRTAPAPDPNEHLGYSVHELLGLRQLQLQLPAMLLIHWVCYKRFSTNKKSYFHSQPNTMAHYVPFLMAFQFMAVYGAYLWWFDADLAAMDDKIWGYHPGAEIILISMLAIQSYDVPISTLVLPFQPTMCAHHAVVLALSYFSTRYRAFYYYAVYFLGVIELSSPFLAVVDAMRDFPKLASDFPLTNEVCRVVFAVVFYCVRVVGWVPVSINFWRDCLSLLKADAAMHTMPKFVPVFWLTTHAGLTCLQAWWGYLILKAVYAMITGDEEARKNEAKNA